MEISANSAKKRISVLGADLCGIDPREKFKDALEGFRSIFILTQSSYEGLIAADVQVSRQNDT